VLALLEAPPVTEQQPEAVTFKSGQVLAIWGPSGSPGKSTLAINVALELAIAGNTVLLIDADTHAPSLEIQLNLIDHPAGLAAACRLAAQDRLTLDEVRRLSQLIEVSGTQLHAMTGISSSTRWPEVTPEKLERLVGIATSGFDYVVIDLASETATDSVHPASGLERNCATVATLSIAHIVITVALADPVGIRRFILARQALGELKLEAEVLTVVNRLRSSVIGNNPRQQIADTLARFASLEVDAFLPDEPETLDRCILESTPIALAKRKSAVRQAIALLVKNHILKQSNPLEKRVARLD
jgi:MinD-like ATPase involved in chromosome partitioning or flagellar assembly